MIFPHDWLIFTWLIFHVLPNDSFQMCPPTTINFFHKWFISFQMCFPPHMILFFFTWKIFRAISMEFQGITFWNTPYIFEGEVKEHNITLLFSSEHYRTAIRVNSTSSIISKIKISGRTDNVVGIFRKAIFIGSPKETVFPQNSSKLRPFTPQAKQTCCTACKNSETFKLLPESFLFFHILFCLCIRIVLKVKIKNEKRTWKWSSPPKNVNYIVNYINKSFEAASIFISKLRVRENDEGKKCNFYLILTTLDLFFFSVEAQKFVIILTNH